MYFFTLFLVNVKLVPLIVSLNFSFILFTMGMVGIVWNKRNFLVLLLCIELVFFSVSLNFVFFSVYSFQIVGQLICLLVITAAAAETAIGLSLLVTAYRLGSEVSYHSLVTLRG
jgi:NADH-quinone oxidoreductase subunit K